jgi:hypothetical protein
VICPQLECHLDALVLLCGTGGALFALGGPMCWCIGSCVFSVQVKCTGQLRMPRRATLKGYSENQGWLFGRRVQSSSMQKV